MRSLCPRRSAKTAARVTRKFSSQIAKFGPKMHSIWRIFQESDAIAMLLLQLPALLRRRHIVLKACCSGRLRISSGDRANFVRSNEERETHCTGQVARAYTFTSEQHCCKTAILASLDHGVLYLRTSAPRASSSSRRPFQTSTCLGKSASGKADWADVFRDRDRSRTPKP